MNGCPVTYRIDAEGKILGVGPAWDDFARNNAAPTLTAPNVLGRCLWESISDPTTRTLYRRMVERVHGDVPEVKFTFRCDAPFRRRLLQMRITRAPLGGTEFEVLPIAFVDRAPVMLLDPSVPHAAGHLRMCSWCKRVPLPDGTWAEVEEAVERLATFHGTAPLEITHGICPRCEEALFGLVESPSRAMEGEIRLGAYP